MNKKFLSSLLIGAFVFGLGAADVQPVNAATADKVKATKQKYDQMRDGDNMTRQMPPRNSDGNNTPPEPPKDENGNPMPPPDRNNGDNSNRPEPPKDENGNPMPPPDRNNAEHVNK